MTFGAAAALILSVLLALWFGGRYLYLRRQLADYARALRQQDLSNLPVPIGGGMEDVASALNSLATDFHHQLSTLDSERARLAAVLDEMTDGVLIADDRGLIRFANPAARRLFDAPSPLEHTVVEVVRNHQLVEAWRRCRQTADLQSESVEIPARHQFLHLLVMPDLHAGGCLLLVQDLTRVRRLETIRQDFISNISHELRTPLASLKALTETLQDGALSDPEAAPRFLGRMVTEVDALNQMAQELLDLSRIESGQVELHLEEVAPRKLLLSAAERMKMQIQRGGLTLHVVCPDDLANIQADAARLEQVLVNLIHNAVKFTRPGGELSLKARSAGGEVSFEVQDTGIGIPSDEIPRIFERFYRVDKSRSGSGTGLGLSIARHIVEAHRGKIWVESWEGRGSTFFFTIPVV